ACPLLTCRLEGEGRILGAGNGDPAYPGEDHPKQLDCREFSIPAFNGLAQVIIQSNKTAGALLLKGSANQLTTGELYLQSK
ncbi:MAG: hypothetical protein II404_14325, partial [Prevotella sp.]|nr:hypothetical protein [Prevotella sp.]